MGNRRSGTSRFIKTISRFFRPSISVIERPGYDNLNPFVIQLDRYNYQQGNPNLQPQYSHNIELSYNYKGALNISLNYTVATDISSAILASSRGMFSLGAAKQVLGGKGSVKLSLQDPLYLMSFTGNTNLDNAVTRTHAVWDNRRAIFTFTYRLGKTGNGSSQHKSSADDEQSRVKTANQQ